MSEVLLYTFSHQGYTLLRQCLALSMRRLWRCCMHGGSGDVGASVLRSKERGFCSVVRFLSKWRWDQGLLYFPLLGSGDAVAGAPSGPLLPPTWLPSSFSSSLGCWKLSTEVDRMGMCG